MSLQLTKGQKIDITKENPLTRLKVCIGWDTQGYGGGNSFDLDSVVAMTKDGKCGDDDDMIYYGNLKDRNNAVIHNGDNLTGAGDGDDEIIDINLANVPDDIDSLDFHVVIYKYAPRNQNFGMVNNSFARVVNPETNEELCRFDLSEDYSTSTRLYIGSLYRHNGEWKFKAVGEGLEGGLSALGSQVGLQ